MRIWLYQHGDLPIVGPMLQELWVAYAMSWSGALFDLAIVPALLWRRAGLLHAGCVPPGHVGPFPATGDFPVADDRTDADFLCAGLATPLVAAIEIAHAPG